MQTPNYWKQFEITGKIEDYLSYKNSGSRSDRDSGERSAEAGWKETGEYAGIYTGDRDDLKPGAYR